MQTVGIISDTHGFIQPQILDWANQCDFIVHAGDVVDENILKQLKPRQKTVAVAGNNDEHIVYLPKVARLDLAGGALVVEHGDRFGRQVCHAQLRQDHSDAKMIIYGHTHKQALDLDAYPWVVNPGAAGRVRTFGGAGFVRLTIDDAKVWQLKSYQLA